MKLLFILMLSSILFSCRKPMSGENNRLTLALSDEIATLDPATAYDAITASVLYQSYETLYEYHYLKRPFAISPLLAEDLPKVENDGKRYIIKIRKNVQYHDNQSFGGKPHFVTAHDFVNSIKRLAFTPLNSGGAWLFEGKIVGFNEFRDAVKDDFTKMLKTPMAGVNAPDDYTLIIDLIHPYPQMIYALTLTFTSPLPEPALQFYKNDLRTIVVGTGPYKLDTWNEQKNLNLSRFAHYRDSFYPTQGDRIANEIDLLKDANKKIPFIEFVNYEVIKEPSDRWQALVTKRIDSINVPKDYFSKALDGDGTINDELEKDGFLLQVTPTLTFWWIAFNMKDPLLTNNKNLRLAIAHAIDTEKYIRTFTNNVSQKANSIYPPGVPGYDPTVVPPYNYDLKKAREYLELAGYPNGAGLKPIRYDIRGIDSVSKGQAEFIKSELAEIGIKIDISINTFPEFLKKASKGDLVMWQEGWTLDYPDAENVVSLLVSSNAPPGPNASFYSNKRVDELYEKLKSLPDGKEKFSYMREIEAEVMNDVPWIVQYYSRNYVVHKKELKNYRPNDLINNAVKYFRIDRQN